MSKYYLLDFSLKVVLPFVITIVLVNTFLDRKVDDKNEQVMNAWMTGNKQPALTHLKKQVENDFFNLEVHRRYLNCEHEVHDSPSTLDTQSKAVIKTYMSHTQSDDPNTRDIGYYALGYFHSIRSQHQKALEHFESVQNRSLIYLNNSIGYCHQELGNPDKAIPYYLDEVELNGNIGGAYSNLSRLYVEKKEFTELNKLIQNEKARPHISPRIIRYIELRRGNFLPYLKDALGIPYTTGTGFFAALFILFIWFQYLRKLDIFEPEPLRLLLSVLIAGMIFSMACDFLYDFYRFNLNMKIKNLFVNDLAFCILGIGFIEETVKIIPFLIILRFTKQINESIDYIVYAAVSALGFAFMENLLYFQDYGLQSISGRCLTAVIMHMTLTSLVAYGLFFAKYKKKNPLKYFIIAFIAACIIHGLYDLWIISEAVSYFKFLSVLILIFCIVLFSKMIKNALNQSEFNIEQKKSIEGLGKFLVYSLSYVFLLQYVLLAWKFGADNAQAHLLKTISGIYIFLLIIFCNLGKINITQGKWIPLFNNSNQVNQKNEKL